MASPAGAASSEAAAIMQRIGAMATVLTRVQGTASSIALSRQQVGALRDIVNVSRGSLSNTELAALSVELCKANIHEEVLADALSIFVPTGASSTARRTMQDYDCFVHFIPQSEWNVLLSADTLESLKERLIINAVIRVGGRTLREPTLKLMYSLLVTVCGKNSMDPQAFKHGMERFKRAFKEQASAAGLAPVHLTKLPATPHELLHDHRRMYEAAFPSEMPAACPLDMDSIRTTSASHKCRGFGQMGIMPSPCRALQPADAGLGATGALLNQLMAHLTKSQENMFAQLMGHAGPAHGGRAIQAGDIKLTFNKSGKVRQPECGAEEPKAVALLWIHPGRCKK